MASYLDADRAERTLLPLVEATAQIQRTMVVGLGGTGAEVIKRLRRRLGRQGQTSTYIRFLSLDTDVRSWLASLQFPALEPRERVALSCQSPEHVLQSPHLYPTVAHLFHQGRKLDLSILADASGAGLMPVVGRAAFHLNAPQIYAQLQRALRDLQAMPNQPGGQPLTEEFRIYVVGSVAGGTGAGTFLETAVLLRHVLSAYKYQLIGLMVLPEAFAPTLRGQQLDSQSRGNAYAVLKEMQYLQDGPAFWDDPDAHTFRFQLGGDVRTVTLNEKPFHILYVLDNQNQEGGGLRHLTDIYEMVSQQLSVEIGSPFGAKFASAQANDRAVMGLAPCPETGRPANISSLATAALVIPEEKLTRYCVRRYLTETLRDRLLGESLTLEESESAALAWLQRCKLEERSPHRMLTHALLTDSRDQRERVGSEYALDPEAVLDRPVPEFLAALKGEGEHFQAQGLPAVRYLVERNLERIQAEAERRLAEALEETSTNRGVRAAGSLRLALEREIGLMMTELSCRQQEDEQLREEAADRLDQICRDLHSRAGLLGALFGKRRELMRQAGRLQVEYCQAELDLAAKVGAMRLMDRLRTALMEHRRTLEGLEANLLRLQQTVSAELAQEEWGLDQGSAYALETEVLSPAQFPAYYERFKPASAQPFIGALGSGLMAVLGSKSSTEASHLLRRAAQEMFGERVRQLNVVDVLSDLPSKAEAFSLLDDLARRCRPFWTATPRGAGAFSDVFLIGSPGIRPQGEGTPVQAEPLLQEWVERHADGGGGGIHSTPTYVALGHPGAIIFSRQTHGARLHYLRQMLDYQEHYRQLQQQRGYPLHFKTSLEALPELRPDDERATECWALGVAYGMIAAKTFGWVWAYDQEQRQDGDALGTYKPVDLLRSGSLWDLAVEIAPVESREITAHSSRFLHATRPGAMGQFAQRRDWIAVVERMVQRRLDAQGKQTMAKELRRYVEAVLASRASRMEEADSSALHREQAAIRRFVDRLNL